MIHREFYLSIELRADTAVDWLAERRRRYLLVDVAFPRSVDTRAWPNAAAGLALLVSVVEASEEDHQPFGSWDRVEPPSGRTFLGHDVADANMLSALSNCGLAPREQAEARCRWALRLNQHHLFECLDDALAFRHYANVHVPEHAPVFVFGLYATDATDTARPVSALPAGC